VGSQLFVRAAPYQRHEADKEGDNPQMEDGDRSAFLLRRFKVLNEILHDLDVLFYEPSRQEGGSSVKR
jgi:hypothetical protein